MTAPVATALAGFGWWGRKMFSLLHEQEAELRIDAVIDPALDRAEAQRLGLRQLPDLNTALADSEIEAVILATPHEQDEQQVIACASAGKHTFCEKPLALHRAGAERMVAACRAAGVVLGIGHERRFEPPLARMLADAAAGRFGRLMQIEAHFSHDKFLALQPGNWRLDPRQAPVAGLTATGIHLTDLAIELMGEAADVRVLCENLASPLPAGDTMSCHVRFRGGGSAYISACLALPFISRFAAYGSAGWMEIRDKAHLESPQGWLVIVAQRGGPIQHSEVPAHEAVLDNLKAFAAAVRGVTPYPIRGEVMIANVALLEAIVGSAASGAVVQVE